ncbi:MAG: peptidase, partial [Flavobacteriales bacterium]|nr:peptidase [Flavobacteriales bacterium]
RSFLVYDEGCLWVLNKARENGEIPEDCQFKVSAHCGHGNPCSAKLLENIGANSINPVRDIQLQMLSGIRQAIDIPIDVHTENPSSTGGFIRHYEVPEMIRIASPIYLKTGGSVAKNHSWNTSEPEARARAKQVMLVQRMIDNYYPEALPSPKDKG